MACVELRELFSAGHFPWFLKQPGIFFPLFSLPDFYPYISAISLFQVF